MAKVNRLGVLGSALAAELAGASNGSIVELPRVGRFWVQVTKEVEFALPTGEARTRPSIHRFILFTAPSLLLRLNEGDVKEAVEPTDLGWLERAGVPREEAMELLADLADRLVRGETVRLTGFGQLGTGPGPGGRKLTVKVSPTGHRVMNP